MKYFYQQLFGFLSVVIVSVVVSGLLFYNAMYNNIYEQRSQQLFGYAKSIIVNQLSVDDINQSMKLLKDDHVSVALFDADNHMVYPEPVMTVTSALSDEELLELRNGSAINLKQVRNNYLIQGEELVTVYYPIFKNQTFSGFLAIASPLSKLQTEIKGVRNSIVIGFSTAAIVGILMSLVFANYQTKRIGKLRKATHEIAEGNFEVSLPNKHRDEFDELASDFNTMVESLQRSEEEVERQENLRRQFMMDVAHEMRTPLTTMNGLLEGLMYNMIPESRRERSLELITKETQRLIRLVNENLDYEKIRSNQVVLVRQKFMGKEVIRSVVEQLHELTKQKQNTLTYDVPDDYTVYADYDRYIQILVNLTKNANQFTDNGTITIKGWNADHKAYLQVTDTGIGIDPKEVHSIWERFYKVDVSRKSTKYGESGIGLAIVQSLVRSHNATIDVESELGKGTTFTVAFPCKDEDVPESTEAV